MSSTGNRISEGSRLRRFGRCLHFAAIKAASFHNTGHGDLKMLKRNLHFDNVDLAIADLQSNALSPFRDRGRLGRLIFSATNRIKRSSTCSLAFI